MTLSKYDAMMRDLDKIMDLHACDPANRTGRAVGGDPYEGAGTSIWGCADCLQMKFDVIAKVYDDARIEPRS